MDDAGPRLWQLVTSLAGRDDGQSYLVCGVGGDGFAELTDGDKRRIETPKRKNMRHLVWHPAIAAELVVKSQSGAQVKNSEVRDALRRLLEEVLPGSAEE